MALSRLLGAALVAVLACSAVVLDADRVQAQEGLGYWDEPDPSNTGEEYAAAEGGPPSVPQAEPVADSAGDYYGPEQPAAAEPAAAEPAAAGDSYPAEPDSTLYTDASQLETPVQSPAAEGIAEPDPLYGGPQEVSPQEVSPQEVSLQEVSLQEVSPGYPQAIWYPASEYGYTAANRPESHSVDKIVVHTTQGSWDSALGWFQEPAAGASAHYTVRSSDGAVGQSVSEQNIAHHAGNWDYNQTSVGVEHEGYVSDPAWYTDTMYRSSAELGAYLVNKYGIPVDRQHIIGHDEVPGATHTDPGPYWDWDLYLSYIQQYAGGVSPANATPEG